jgi:hypothetical protein
MALVNPNIAMSFRQPEFRPRNALAEYAQVQQIMSAQDAQQMNALKMQEAQETIAERNALRRLNPLDQDYESQLFRVSPQLGIQYRKERAATEASAASTAASRAAAQKSQFDLITARRKFADDLKRGLSANPSDANIIAFGEDAVLQGLYTQDQVNLTVNQLLGLSIPERTRILSQSGASSSDLISATTTARGQDITIRGQDIGATTAARGQDITARGQDIGAATATRGQDIGATTAIRGQDIGAETTRRGQDIGATTAIRGQDIGAETTRRGQDIGATTAIRGQDIGAQTAAAGQQVTMRGQDIGAATAAAGQAVTQRGQDLQDKRDRERIRQEGQRIGLEGRRVAVLEENQRRDADPAFQQRMAAAKETGQAIAKGDVAARQALPKIITRAEEGLRLIDEMIGKQEVRDASGKVIQAATKPHPGFNDTVGTLWSVVARNIPGTDAADFRARFDQIKGASFLEAFESLKGGGAITEKEGAKATDAINRMALAQSEREFIAAARDLQEVVRKGVANAQRKAGAGAASTSSNIDALVEKYK